MTRSGCGNGNDGDDICGGDGECGDDYDCGEVDYGDSDAGHSDNMYLLSIVAKTVDVMVSK